MLDKLDKSRRSLKCLPIETFEPLIDSSTEESTSLKKMAKPLEKEYGYQPNFHLGCYQTVRGPSSKEVMGLGTIFVNSIEKKKTTDGLTIPLAYSKKAKRTNKWIANVKRIFKNVIRDWIFLALLGFIMAAFSFAMDFAILKLQTGQMLLYEQVQDLNIALSLLVWVGYVVGLIVASAIFAHYVAPQAIGSGIPEMKTILRGVILKEYLSVRTLISKIIGLTLSLGSGLPMGKEGPFVHVASVVASQLSRLVHGSSAGIFENESRSGEMLAAGCAVGVACTFSAPIGGVLFSIEVTSVYFAVRNYWRGFFAATCSATLFRILRMFSVSDSVTVEAHYQTNFPPQNAFMPHELPVFALIGLVCGFLGSAFVYIHRRLVLFLRRNGIAKKIFQKYWLVYPICVATFIASLTYPNGLGQLMGGKERFSHTMNEFFVNCTWTAKEGSLAACPPQNSSFSLNGFDIHHWTGADMSFSPFLTLATFQCVYFFLAILASTLPVPSGIFMPVFVLGAAFGRLIGEGVYQIVPDGFLDDDTYFVRPGIYAVVGAAAFCGAVTHTVSVAVIVFELTGQLCALLPVMIAVLIANAIASYLQPSIYDSIIRIKNLPYLPDIPHTSSLYHQMLIEQFMISPVVWIAKDSTIGDIKKALDSKTRIRAFPLVDSTETLALIGSISRSQLQKLIDTKIGTKARFAEATKRIKDKMNEEEEEKRRKEELSTSANGRRASRFLVVPVEKAGTTTTTTTTTTAAGPTTSNNLSDENARKILTDAEKQALFDAAAVDSTPRRDGATSATNLESHHTIGDIFRSITHLSFGRSNVQKKNEFDLFGNERISWESTILREKINLNELVVDSAPFQLSEFTSLFKAHSLFSLLGLNRAYVTKRGQLIGVVALKELRFAIEYLQAGKIPRIGKNIFEEGSSDEESSTMVTFGCDKASGRANGGQEDAHYHRNNGGYVMDDGQDDADEDYIQPPIEVLRTGTETPMPPNCVSDKSLLCSPSTNSSCVKLQSIEIPKFEDAVKEEDSSLKSNTSSGIIIEVSDLIDSTKSTDTVSTTDSSTNKQVKIVLPDGRKYQDEKF